jgi:hypothetical protein
VIGSAFGESDDPVVEAPAAPPVVEAPAPEPEPEPAPEPEPEADPDTYGDDAELDALWTKCAIDDLDACDELYWTSPLGSGYEAYALDRIAELDQSVQQGEQDIADEFGAAFFLDMLWADMDLSERAEICLGVGLFGAEGAAQIIVDEAPAFDVGDVAAWLAEA